MSTGNSEQAFGLLSTSRATLGTIRVHESTVSAAGGYVLHGMDENEHLHLLVPLTEAQAAVEDKRSAGVQLRALTLSGDGAEMSYQDVICTLPHLNALFYVLADEMLGEMAKARDAEPQACLRVLDRWRELLERAPGGMLGPEKLAGLLGELIVLERLARKAGGGVLACWAGPDSHRFDFLSADQAIEVKVSLAHEGKSVEIHGDRQLEPPAGGELLLVFLRMERAEGPIVLPELVDRIVECGISRMDLRGALAKAGVSAGDVTLYGELGYSVVEESFYRVDSGFPRIVPESFISGRTPEGVGQVRYRVDLSAARPGAMTARQVEDALNRFLGGA